VSWPSKRTILWIARLLLGLAIIGVLLWLFDWRAIWTRISAAQPLGIAAAIGLILLQTVVFALRWRFITSGMERTLSVGHAILGSLELGFVNLFLPTAIAGDAARIARAHRAGLPLGEGIVSVFLDRALGLSTLVMLAAVTFLTIPSPSGSNRLALLSGGLTLLSIAALVVLYYLEPRLTAFMHYRPVHFVGRISSGFRFLVRNPVIGASATVASLLGYAINGAALLTVATSMSVPVSYPTALSVVCAIALAVFIPASIGGWGTREGAAVLVFGLFHVGPEDALGISILYGAAVTVVGLVGGVVLASSWLTRKTATSGADRGEVVRDVREPISQHREYTAPRSASATSQRRRP